MSQQVADPARIVIAGGGFAALETLLALRALTGDRTRIALVCPDRTFAYRPAATAEAFTGAQARTYDLGAIAADLGATVHRARLEAVAPKRRYARLSNGARLQYEALVLALGARARPGIHGALMFRDQRDVPQLRRLLAKVREGRLRRLVFASPPGHSWPVSLYEVALQTAAFAREHRMAAEISIVSPNDAPLTVLGTDASALVAGLLRERGIRFVGNVNAIGVQRGGWLACHGADPIAADRVITVPQLRGQRITGIPSTPERFIATDGWGRVPGLTGVYAAGDVTTYPIKQGGLATQQADRVASAIGGALGIEVEADEGPAVLRTRLLGGSEPLYLCTELDERGRPSRTRLEHGGEQAARRASKVYARHLTPYLLGHERLAA